MPIHAGIPFVCATESFITPLIQVYYEREYCENVSQNIAIFLSSWLFPHFIFMSYTSITVRSIIIMTIFQGWLSKQM